jgi:Asp-tRNA(Asn)/Glu-tRNA(Gln) amidotransferase A subunit family amidase
MSETPKAKTTAKKPAPKKAVRADSTNADKPVKATKTTTPRKAPVKKTTAEQVIEAIDEALEVVEANKATVKKVVKTVAPKVTDEQVDNLLFEAPSFWAKVKAFFTGK